MSTSIKHKVINKIIEVEGGYVNDPSDSGGETMYGVTIAVARKSGYLGPMRSLPRSLAFDIYAKKYWDVNCLDGVAALSEEIAEELADTGVNMGVRRAGKFLQQSLNILNNRGSLYSEVLVDGIIGKGTIKALSRLVSIRGEKGIKVLYRMLNSLQGSFYIDLATRREKDEKFIYGWFLHRVK